MGGGHQEIEREVAVGDRIEAVGGRHRESQRLGGSVAVDREARPRERRRAERALARPAMRIDKARTIALRHLVIGHQVMAERDGLRGLEVGEAGHDAAGMFFGAGDQRNLQRTERRVRRHTGCAPRA
jgi:hypothetical protein